MVTPPLSLPSQVIRTARYFNSQSQPNGQAVRSVSVSIPDGSVFVTDTPLDSRVFLPCAVRIVVVNTPDSPMVNLPLG